MSQEIPPDRPAEAKDPLEARLALSPPELLANLTNIERMLLVMRDELYESSWQIMERDLRDRLQGRPYIYKLVNKIETDLAAIAFLRAYETRHRVDLGRLQGGETA